jgi:hypothetical protein
LSVSLSYDERENENDDERENENDDESENLK